MERFKKIWRKYPWKSYLKTTAMVFLWVFVLGTIVFLSFFIYLRQTLPDPESIASRKVKESTKIYDRTGEILLYDIYDEEKRTVIPWEQIPENIKQATLVAEDSDFYKHQGLDLRGIARAVVRNLQSGEFSEGGSTITQQLVKKALFGDEKTLSRKLREVMLAIEIERRFSKDEIFWMYLNQIPYGSNAYGIDSASRTFFGKSPLDLTLGEAATLAALPNAPSYYSPFGSHVDALMARKDWVLDRMLSFGHIDQKELEAARATPVVFKKTNSQFVAPHFVIMIKEYLINKYGQDIVESNGFKITTTLDADLQQKAEELVKQYSKINKDRYKATNASLVSLDPRTGDVLALIGSSDYFDVENQGNFNVALAKRQPGSAFKPFAYAAAFQKGYTDYSVLFDLKTEFNPLCNPAANQVKDKFGADCYHPQNYDGQYRGPVTLRRSLAQSLNVPSVKTLYLAGIEGTIDLAQKMGITTLEDRSRFGLSLVLGGAEVRLIDLASAYGVFANDGIRNPWALIEKVETHDGTVLEEKRVSPQRVISDQVARLMNDVLSDNNARSAVFGFNSPLYIPGQDVAAKTGTTQNNRDAWLVGYTPSVVVGVWTGNNDNTSMTREGAGVSAAGPLWNAFTRYALTRYAGEGFRDPDPISRSKFMINGKYHYQKDDATPPEFHSILYFVNKNDPLGPSLANPYDDPQFANWEWAVTRVFPAVSPSPSPSPTPF